METKGISAHKQTGNLCVRCMREAMGPYKQTDELCARFMKEANGPYTMHWMMQWQPFILLVTGEDIGYEEIPVSVAVSNCLSRIQAVRDRFPILFTNEMVPE